MMAREMISHFDSLKSMIKNNYRFNFDKFMVKFESNKRLQDKLKNSKPDQVRNKERQMLENLEKENIYYSRYFKNSTEIKIRNGQTERLRKDNIERGDWIKEQENKVVFA